MATAGAADIVSTPPSAARMTSRAPACTNCGSAVVATYCAECGEKQPSRHDFSLRGLAADVFHDVTSVDGRLLRSLVALLTKPGLLTREWFEGRRGRYVKPFSLFVVLNVVFFVIQPHTQLLSYRYDNYVYGQSATSRDHFASVQQRRAKTGDTQQQFEARFNASLQDGKKSLLVFCIPVLALALTVLYAGRGRYFAEHLVFSIHTYAYFLVFMGAVVPFLQFIVLRGLVAIGAPHHAVEWMLSDAGLTVVLAVVIGSYVYLALRRVYGDGPVAAAVRAAIVFMLVGQLTNVYHNVLFYTTLYSL
jgi:hypothetical protein